MKDSSSAESGAKTAAGRTLRSAKGSFPTRDISDRWLDVPEEACLTLHGEENGRHLRTGRGRRPACHRATMWDRGGGSCDSPLCAVCSRLTAASVRRVILRRLLLPWRHRMMPVMCTDRRYYCYIVTAASPYVVNYDSRCHFYTD